MVKVSSPGLRKALGEDYENYALSFFFSSCILLPSDLEVHQTFFDCLYPVWMKSDSSSPLRPAVAAVALCLLVAWLELNSALPMSLPKLQYVKGVAALRRSLLNANKVDDDVLMAALMLGMYEEVTAFLMAKPNNSPHVNGTVALIEYRRRQPFTTETSQRVLLAARSQIVSRALRNSKPVPPAVSTWVELTPNVPKTAGFRFDELNLEIANLQASISHVTLEGSSQHLSILDILNAATELDRRLLAWTETTPADWTPIRVSGPDCIPQSVRRSGLYQKHCNIYKSISVANVFNSYYCARIKLQLIIISCLAYLDNSNSGTTFLTCLEIIQEMVDKFCASISFYLGDRMTTGRIDDKTVQYPHIAGCPVPGDHYVGAAALGGWFLAARFSELLSLEVPLRAGQRQWIGSQMQRIKVIYAVQSLQ